MRIYLDVSCLNRPFDDQSQARIRLEAEATTVILGRCERGDWQQVSSEMSRIEVEAMPDADRRARVLQLLPESRSLLRLTESVFARAKVLQELGFKPADAVHMAAAESLQADVFLSCDDRLVRQARRRRDQLMVRVGNPLEWLTESDHGADA